MKELKWFSSIYILLWLVAAVMVGVSARASELSESCRQDYRNCSFDEADAYEFKGEGHVIPCSRYKHLEEPWQLHCIKQNRDPVTREYYLQFFTYEVLHVYKLQGIYR